MKDGNTWRIECWKQIWYLFPKKNQVGVLKLPPDFLIILTSVTSIKLRRTIISIVRFCNYINGIYHCPKGMSKRGKWWNTTTRPHIVRTRNPNTTSSTLNLQINSDLFLKDLSFQISNLHGKVLKSFTPSNTKHLLT